jgi:hypothetical protein
MISRQSQMTSLYTAWVRAGLTGSRSVAVVKAALLHRVGTGPHLACG